MRSPTLRLLVITTLFVLAVVASACSLVNPTPTPTPTAEATPLPTPTATPLPSPTPLPPLAILLAPQGADPTLVNALQPVLGSMAEQAGMRFQVRPVLGAAELAEASAVVVLPPDPGVVSLAAAAPGVQFLAVGIPGLTASGNLSVVDSSGGSPDQMGFLAGFIAAEMTADWRVGIITESGSDAGKDASLGYANGVTYFCGLCLPAYPPFPASGYPIVVEIPASAGPADWNAAVTYLASWQVNTVYVVPAVAQSALLDALSQSGMQLILAGAPPSNLEWKWAASLGTEDPVKSVLTAWETMLQGSPGGHIALQLKITGADPDLFSPGKQRLAEEMLADLSAGLIGTGAGQTTPAP